MAKKKKERADKYEEKLTFDGDFEEMIKISIKDTKKKSKPEKK